jgi:hypothetical protein
MNLPDIHSGPVKHGKHIDAPLAEGEEEDVCQGTLLSTIWAQMLDDILCQLGECKVRSRIQDSPDIGFTSFLTRLAVPTPRIMVRPGRRRFRTHPRLSRPRLPSNACDHLSLRI